MNKFRLLISFILILTLTLGACSTPANSAGGSTATTLEDTATASTAKKPVIAEKGVTITDGIGREVVLPATVKTAVSSYYPATNAIVTLGAKDRLVAIEDKADSREFYRKYFPEAMNLPGIGNVKNINVEEIAKLEPEVVFIPFQQAEMVEQFEALGIPVIVVRAESYSEMMDFYTLLGQVFGIEDRAQKLIDFYNKQLEKIAALPAQTPAPSLYISRSSEFLEGATPLMFQATMVEKAGGRLVTADLTENYWAKISVEQLQSYNPDIIVLSNGSATPTEDILADSRFSGLKAIETQKVYVFPAELEAWDMPTPASILGILWLSQLIHPEDYTEADLAEDVVAYYTQFFGV